jgi:transaldolase
MMKQKQSINNIVLVVAIARVVAIFPTVSTHSCTHDGDRQSKWQILAIHPPQAVKKGSFHRCIELDSAKATTTMKQSTIIAVVAILIDSTSAFSKGPPGFRGEARFFLDTADTREWDDLLPLGIFHGVTTNPTLLERSHQPCTISHIQMLAKRALTQTEEFMCQSWGATSNEMYQTGMQLSEVDRARIVIKVPVTARGMTAAARLIKSGVRVCLTACYDSKQALLAGAVGAEYLAPYLGRMTDSGKNGMEECMRMQDIVEGLGSETRILVASIRDVESFAVLAEAGLDTFTFSPQVARELFDEPLTDAAAQVFEESAARGSTYQ